MEHKQDTQELYSRSVDEVMASLDIDLINDEISSSVRDEAKRFYQSDVEEDDTEDEEDSDIDNVNEEDTEDDVVDDIIDEEEGEDA